MPDLGTLKDCKCPCGAPVIYSNNRRAILAMEKGSLWPLKRAKRRTMPDSQRPRVRSVQVNKNFCNYPLACDPRTRQRWRRSRPSGFWLCDLPGDDRIRFQIERDGAADLRHCPTAFDINVLLLVLGMAQDRGKRTVALPSSGAILKALGRGVDSGNRRLLKTALQYWNALSIWFDCWHQKGKKKRVTKTLPPPIQSLADDGRQLKVTIREEWLALNEGYFTTLHLPLPLVQERSA